MKKAKKHKKRRRVGAMSLGKPGTMLKLASLAAGYYLSFDINTQVDKIIPTYVDTTVTPNVTKPNEMVAIAGELGLGGLLLMKKFAGGTMGTVLTVAGGVLAGAGIKRALKKAGVISGYQAVPVIGGYLGKKRMAGYQSVPVLGGIPAQLAGGPAQLQGYGAQGSGVGGYVSAGSGAKVMGSVGGFGSGSGVTTSGTECMS
jgi:hypothetical protein